MTVTAENVLVKLSCSSFVGRVSLSSLSSTNPEHKLLQKLFCSIFQFFLLSTFLYGFQCFTFFQFFNICLIFKSFFIELFDIFSSENVLVKHSSSSFARRVYLSSLSSKNHKHKFYNLTLFCTLFHYLFVSIFQHFLFSIFQ